MNAQNIGTVLVRLFCIYLAITALQNLSYVLPSLVQFVIQGGSTIELSGSAPLWLALSGMLLPAICAIWLWRNTDVVLPREAADDSSGATAHEIMLVGVSLMGLYLLVWGLIGLVQTEASIAGARKVVATVSMSQRMTHLAQVAISLVLLLGRRRISELLLKAKFAGTGRD